jgi:alpha-L-fucosidase
VTHRGPGRNNVAFRIQTGARRDVEVVRIPGTAAGAWSAARQPTGNTGGLVLDLGGNKTFDVISVQEDLNVGMRTLSFAVDRWTGSGWTQLATDTTIGHKKLVRLGSPVTTDRVRLRITASRAAPAIASFGLFKRGGGTGPTPGAGLVRSGLQGKCLDVPSGADGTRATIWDCNGNSNQTWTVTADRELRAHGKCLDVYGGQNENGIPVQLYTCNGGNSQQWVSTSGALVNPQSGRCLDVPAFSSNNGTQLVIWECNGGANQRWILP